MNYKELSYAFKKIMSWYKKKTKVLNIKSRPYNTGFVFFDLISRLINDNKKVLYVFSVDSDEIKGKSHNELYMKSIQKIMPGDIENGITFISIDEIENIGEEYSLIVFDDITMFSKSTIKDMRDAVEKVYWKVNKIIIYSCERVFPIGEKMDLVYLLNPMPMIEPRFLNTRIKLEDDIPLAVYEYVKWFSYNNKNVIIMVPDEEKLSKVYYTYKNNLKDNNARVVKYEKGDDFKHIENIIKSEPAFIVTNSMGDYINSIEDVNILILFGDNASYTYKRIVYLCGCIDVKSDILPEVLLVSRETSVEMDKSRNIIREFNKKLWEKKLLR